MQIDAHKRTVGEVLQLGQHIVPRYQRRYAWEPQNIKDFWSDINSSADPHFIGSMVTSGVASSPREVIDGQQRLTTVIIALAVIRDMYLEADNNQRVTGINEFLEYYDRNGHRNQRLTNRDNNASNRLNDNVLLEKSQRPGAPSFDPESLESQAYSTFESLVRERTDDEPDPVAVLDSIRDAILETEVVYINVEDRRNAFTIFETLNDRGKSLTVMDLIKNLLFAELPQADEDSSERAWSAVNEYVDQLTFDRFEADRFLYYSWNSRKQDGVPLADIIEESRLHRSISDALAASGDQSQFARNLVNEIYFDAQIMSVMNQTLNANGAPDSWRYLDKKWRRDKYEQISDRVYGVLVSGAHQPFPLMLSLMRAYLRGSGILSRKLLIQFLTAVENFQFRWSIAQKGSTSSIRTLYRQTASAVSASGTRQDLEGALEHFVKVSSNIGASDAQFRDGIARLAYSNTKTKDAFKIRHILLRLERSYGATKLDLTHQLSIEHLQGLEGRSEATPRNSWIFKLGNLALVPPEVNASFPKSFEGKCADLGELVNTGDTVLTKAVAEGSWKSDNAGSRLSALTERALVLWPRME